MADYRVLTFALDNAAQRTVISAYGVAVSHIAIIELTGLAPGGVSLRIGAKGDPILLKTEGLTFELGVEEITGIFFDNNALAGEHMTVLIGQTVSALA